MIVNDIFPEHGPFAGDQDSDCRSQGNGTLSILSVRNGSAV